MRILLYEYFSGGGLWSENPTSVASHALLSEGQVMQRSLSHDLHQVPGIELIEFQDVRLRPPAKDAGQPIPVASADQEYRQLAEQACDADGTILIAPEYDGRLLDRCRLVESAGGRLFSPDADFVRLATDKCKAARRLDSAGIPTPEAVLLDVGQKLPESFSYPAVLKPNDGAGSLDTRLVQRPCDAQQIEPGVRVMRLERFCPGIAASVMALCGPRGAFLLPPCRQRISTDHRFRYLGGDLPLAAELSVRACRLARSAFAALPQTTGFVGMDMILGHDSDGRDDFLLDINPRLTTSYAGLRHVVTTNLAAAMLAARHGRVAPLFFERDAVQFDADGTIAPTASTDVRP